MLLLATTNKLCQDVAVIPFLWVAPLALYLLSFIICFDSPRWYVRFPFTLALIAALGGLCWALYNGSDLALSGQVAIYCGGLFICCMVCHGELYRLKPDPSHLTGYYLMIAAGGALGGVLVAVVAPLLFTDYYELHWGLFACGLLFLHGVRLRERGQGRTGRSGGGWGVRWRWPPSPGWTGCWRGCQRIPRSMPRLPRVGLPVFASGCGPCWSCWWRPGSHARSSRAFTTGAC